MTTGSAYSGDDPHRLLSSTHELAQRVRREQRATWFPLLVLAAVTFAAIPVLRYSGRHLGPCAATGPGMQVCTVYPNAQFVYWPIALVLAYVVIAAFYIRRSRARGIETRVRPYAIAGIILAVALLPITFRTPIPSWNLMPQLVTGGTVLLLGGIGFALSQRPLRSPAP
jgi:hypothetical protein